MMRWTICMMYRLREPNQRARISLVFQGTPKINLFVWVTTEGLDRGVATSSDDTSKRYRILNPKGVALCKTCLQVRRREHHLPPRQSRRQPLLSLTTRLVSMFSSSQTWMIKGTMTYLSSKTKCAWSGIWSTRTRMMPWPQSLLKRSRQTRDSRLIPSQTNPMKLEPQN